MCVDLDDERRRALQVAHDAFQHLVVNSPFGVYAVDSDFRLVQVSAGAQKVFEHVRPLLGRDFAEVLRVIWPEPFASEAIALFQHTLATGEPYHAPSTVERRRDVDEVESYDWKIERVNLPDGRPGVVCHFYDLSERQRYEQALRDSHEHVRLAMEAADAGSWVLLPDTGEFTASDRALRLHGLAPGTTTTHQDALARVHPDDVATVEAAVRSVVTEGKPLRLEHRVVHPDGSLHWVAAHAERLTDDGRVRVVGLVQDITRRKRAEHALRARSAEEHEVALSLQRALLPARLPAHPDVQIAAVYRASNQQLEVGGDWYDAITLSDGRLALTVGDVVGHGLEAAAAMGQLRTAVAALAGQLPPAALLTELDAFLTRTQVTELATVCYAVYDPAAGDLTYASAGHPPILSVSPTGQVTTLDNPTAPPLLGTDQPWQREEARVVLEPGTLLLLYSDGLIERRDADLDEGLARLRVTLTGIGQASVDALCGAVLSRMDADASDDDVVILAARVNVRTNA